MKIWGFCIVALGAVLGCTTTRPVVRYPDLAPVPEAQTCLICESDHCFIGAIDGRYIDQYDVNLLDWGTYRHYIVPEGHHTIAVFYRQAWNYDVISGGPRDVVVNVKAGSTYDLASNVHGVDVLVGDVLRNANWRPMLVDSHTGKPVGKASLGDMD